VNRVVQVGRARSDEQIALELYPALRRLAAVIAPVEVAPDDLLHEALLAVLRRGPLASLDDPTAYVAKTMLNLASNHRRRFGRTRRMLHRWRGNVDSAAVDVYPSDLADLAALSPTARAILYLHHVDGWPYDDVASRLDLSLEAVRQIASRARRQLRTHLEEH